MATALSLNKETLDATFGGNIFTATNNTYTIGTSSNKFNAIYATTFYGALSGNASTASTLVNLTTTIAELNYVDGVTSNIQTQLNSKINKFDLGMNYSSASYVTFARTSSFNADGNCGATLLITDCGNFGSPITGAWLVQISNRGSVPTMSVTTILNHQTGTVTFGCYKTTDYFYFGVFVPQWRGDSIITVLRNRDVTLQYFGESTVAPSGWVSVAPRVLSTEGHSHNYLPLSGGTMTGTLTLKGEQFTDNYTGALNCNNSNIYGVNGIYTADDADSNGEGIHFYRTSTTVDTIWAKNGVFYFTPNRTLGSAATNYPILHSGNYTDYTPTKTGYGASGTWGISITGNAATATKLAAAKTISLTGNITGSGSFDGSSNISISTKVSSYYPSSPRDFTDGTLITTNIDYSVAAGAAFYLEIKADTYFDAIPMFTQAQGYIYNNTIISYGMIDHGRPIPELYAMNINGVLCFWFPRLTYWQSFGCRVTKSSEGNYNTNCVVSVTNSTKPSGTKEVAIHDSRSKSLLGGLYGSSISLTGSVTGSGTFNSDGTLSISTTTNHTHDHLVSQGSTVANTRTQSAQQSLITGGWASDSAGYGTTYGTTLDVSGFSSWYHRLAFHTSGKIDYWQGINTTTLTKIGTLLTSSNYTSYVTPSTIGAAPMYTVTSTDPGAGSSLTTNKLCIVYS